LSFSFTTAQPPIAKNLGYDYIHSKTFK